MGETNHTYEQDDLFEFVDSEFGRQATNLHYHDICHITRVWRQTPKSIEVSVRWEHNRQVFAARYHLAKASMQYIGKAERKIPDFLTI